MRKRLAARWGRPTSAACATSAEFAPSALGAMDPSVSSMMSLHPYMLGLSAPYGSWKMICMVRRFGRMAFHVRAR